MTKTIDEILTKVLFVGSDNGKPNEWGWQVINEAKASLLELIKELVEEAKPKKRNTDVGDAYQRTFCGEYNKGIDQFEQNLLKALEEV